MAARREVTAMLVTARIVSVEKEKVGRGREKGGREVLRTRLMSTEDRGRWGYWP